MSVEDIARSGDRCSARSGSRPLLGRKSVLLGMLGSGFVLAQAGQPSAEAATVPATVPAWASATAYLLGQQVISPNNDVVSANTAHTSSTTYFTDKAKWTLSGTFVRQEVFVNVLAAGVKGDGITNDTAAINAAIVANPGKVILFPSGRTYRIVQAADADSVGGILLNRAGTTLSLDGATLQLTGNGYSHSQIINVTAADCKVLGGKLIGDVAVHSGISGEWGYGICVGAGAHRFVAESVYATKCWGDGFFVFGRPIDVSFVNCVADDNRRQGLSIIDAIRPRVSGGAYINTGLTTYTAPGAGIDIEPDPSSGRDVIDAVISGATLSGNAGPGLYSVGATAQTVTATISNCTASGNGVGHSEPGFHVTGPGNTTRLIGCTATSNEYFGFYLDSIGAEATSCQARSNGESGFIVSADACKLLDPVSVGNGGCGITSTGTGTGLTIAGGESKGNGQLATATYIQVDIGGPNTRVLGHTSDAGTSTNKPARGFEVRPTATGAVLLGCSTRGAFTSANYLDDTKTAFAFPVPGVARQSGTPAAATDAASTLALVNSLRTKLITLGLLS